MKIECLSNPIRVCKLIINDNPEQTPLWNIVWDEEISNDILRQENGRCYYIVVNSTIYKIGYSDCKGGIRSTISSYRSSGNSGRPSDRTHGIHILIAEELLKGNNVEIFFNYNDLISIDLKLMDGNSVSVDHSISGKILELKNIDIYKTNNNNNYPIWNLQEANNPWPDHVQESRMRLINEKVPVKLSDIKSRLNKNSHI